MDDAFSFADELGPLKLVHIWRPAVGLKAVVAIDNIACGPAVGGVRMATDVSAEEAFRLARAMTLKNAAAGLPHGGGKSVIFAHPRMPMPDKERLIRAFADAIADLVDYIPGPDTGTDELTMGWINDETGRAVGLPREIGGIPLDELGATGFGLVAAIDVATQSIGLALAGARVVIQGFGSVGKHAARFLAAKGAILVGASDTQGTIADDNGLDIATLIALKAAGRPLHAHPHGRKLDGDAVIDIPCDIWIPAARPDVIHAGNVGRLKARLVAQGANIPCTPEGRSGACRARSAGVAGLRRQCRRRYLCRRRIPGWHRSCRLCRDRREDPRQYESRAGGDAAGSGAAASRGRSACQAAHRTSHDNPPLGPLA
jgi:glutamate dehydrogenase/leucine dehydrogenase